MTPESTEISPPSSSSRQLTLQEAADRTRVWATSNARALRITRKIGEMIAVDCQPLSIVSDPGFVRLLGTVEPRYQIPNRKYITDKALPDIASDVKAKIEMAMNGVQWFSFTSDICIGGCRNLM